MRGLPFYLYGELWGDFRGFMGEFMGATANMPLK